MEERYLEDLLPLMGPLYATALRFTGNPADAEELVQETSYRAWRGFKGFKEGTNFRAWIFRIMNNTFISNWRKKRPSPVEPGSPVLDEAAPPESPWGRDVSDILETVDDDVRAAFLELPDPYREVMELRVFQDLAYQEISDTLEIPVGTVMSRLHRARAAFKETLAKLAGKPGEKEPT